MRDGTLLRADIWTPDVATSAPVLIRTPYSRSLQPVGRPLDVLALVDRGIPVVLQDVRGRGGSEGGFTPFVDEPDDTCDTVEWIADQPWSLGPPALTGPSYMGLVQFQCVTSPDTVVSAISPQFAPLDVHDDWAYRQGVFQLGSARWWHLQAVALAQADRSGRSGERGVITALVDKLRRGEYGDWTSLPQAVAQLAPSYAEWRSQREDDPYWDVPARRPFGTASHVAPVPALLTGGWFDIFLRGTLRAYHQLRRSGAAVQLIIGPWSHVSTLGDFPSRAFGTDASAERLDLTGIHARFFTGVSAGTTLAGPEARVFVMGVNRWVELESWPPPDARTVRLKLTSFQKIGRHHDHATLTFDPDTPVPSLGGATLMPGAYAGHGVGPVDLAPLLEHPDVIAFEIPDLGTDTAIAGPIRLTVGVDGMAGHLDVHASIVELQPSGSAFLVTDGATAHINGDSIRVDLADTALALPVGCRLGLLIAASSFPRYAPTATQADSRASHGLASRPASARLDHGRSHVEVTTITNLKRFMSNG